MKLALGLMSGTSCDGVSLALASFSGKSFKTLHSRTFDYPAALRKTLLLAGELQTPALSRLNFELGIFFAECAARFIREHKIRAQDIAAAGSHGHTVWHAGGEKPAHTLQLGEPSFIAEKLGVPVVADFRPRDIAAGGQGAPLIPFFDDFFFSSKLRAMQNIGGIGNVTIVGGSRPYGFDTGPGNCLMDLAVQKITRGAQAYDKDGKLAAKGKILMEAVKKMAAHPYFRQKPPKSTGRELFNWNFIPASLQKAKPEDLAATLTWFTAFTIRESYRHFAKENIREVVVSGGGALNKTLMRGLSELFAPIPVVSIESFKVPALAKEPVAFAFFALRALEGKTNHLPAGTGASRAVILGKILPALSSAAPEEKNAKKETREEESAESGSLLNLNFSAASRNRALPGLLPRRKK